MEAKRISNYIDQPKKAVVSVEYSGNILKGSFTFGKYDCLKTNKGKCSSVHPKVSAPTVEK